jgi:DNA-binding IclR family transcriptional regulator
VSSARRVRLKLGTNAGPGTKPDAQNTVNVLDKAFELIDELAAVGDQSAAELAKRLDEPRSTVYRLLASLRRHGMVETGPTRGSFRLGLELVRLGGIVVSRFDDRTAALPVLERIHAETGETVFLCVRSGDRAVCIERIDGLHVQSLALRLGGSLPLHAGAASRALLAFGDRGDWERYIDTEPESLTPSTPVERSDLLTILSKTRKQGYAISDGDVTVGIAALGAPIFDHTDKVVASLSMSGLRESILGKTVLRNNRQLVIDGASEVSLALGHGIVQAAGGVSRS